MRNCRLAQPGFFLWFLLLPLLPACSLLPAQHQTLEGFSPESVQQVRLQSAELDQLQSQGALTPAQRKIAETLQGNLRQFEQDVIRRANALKKNDDWYGAEQLLANAAGILPASQPLTTALRQLSQQSQLREARVRMELEIHRGEQLLKDTEAYRQLRQLKGPGVLTWLELKNFQRKRRASAQALQEHAQQALARQDYSLAKRALTIAQGLYGDDLPQDSGQRAQLERNLALATRQLRPVRSKPQMRPVKRSEESEDKVPVADLQHALDNDDLLSARQHLEQLQHQSPQHPQLPPLQIQFETQLHARIQSAIQQGNNLYSQGNIEQALAVWRKASILAPDNVQLLANIARAEKVLQNLRALSPPTR